MERHSHNWQSFTERGTRLGTSKSFEENKTLKCSFSQDAAVRKLLPVPLSWQDRWLSRNWFRHIVMGMRHLSLAPPVTYLRALPKLVEDEVENIQQGGGLSHYSNTVFIHWISGIGVGGQKGETQALSLLTSEGLTAQHFLVYWVCIHSTVIHYPAHLWQTT
jgi:hypothetical protein